MNRRSTVLIGCVAALALSGCRATSSAVGGTTQETQETASSRAEAERRVAGTVFYVERIALTPDAVVLVEVVEAASEGRPEEVVGAHTLQSPGPVPIAFSVAIAPERIRPEARYTVRARITDGDRVFSTPEPVPVLTLGHPSEEVRVRVRIGG